MCSAICDKNNAESGDKKLFTTTTTNERTNELLHQMPSSRFTLMDAFFYICSRYDGDGMSDSYLNSGHIFKLDEEGLESSYY